MNNNYNEFVTAILILITGYVVIMQIITIIWFIFQDSWKQKEFRKQTHSPSH